MITSTTPLVVVVGSVHRDYYRYVAHHPQPGETVLAREVAVRLGGKGANQAVAAARFGAPVTFVGCVGDDDAGAQARSDLIADGIDCDLLVTAESGITGSAFVVVDALGENSIVVHSGANEQLAETLDLRSAIGAVLEGRPGSVVVTQGELPPATIDLVAQISVAVRARFLLNLAPYVAVAPETLACADPLVVNNGEARRLVRQLTHCPADRAAELSDDDVVAALSAHTISVVVTLGAAGAIACAGETAWRQPTDQAQQVVDTTGAGDAFTGALAAALVADESLPVAVERGTRAGSLAVQQQGTTTSYAGGDIHQNEENQYA